MYARVKEGTRHRLLEDQFFCMWPRLCRCSPSTLPAARRIPANKLSHEDRAYRGCCAAGLPGLVFSGGETRLDKVASEACPFLPIIFIVVPEVFAKRQTNICRRRRLANARQASSLHTERSRRFALEIGFESMTSFSALFPPDLRMPPRSTPRCQNKYQDSRGTGFRGGAVAWRHTQCS